MKLAIKAIILTLFMFSLCLAQSGNSVSNVATTSASFLEIGVGSRAVAMGGAFVATANDASAMYWNAAGLGLLKNIETIFVHTDWLAGISYDYAGIIFPLMNDAAIGLSIIR